MKRGWSIFGLVAVLALAGCGAALPDMTEEEAKAVGEYAAIMLLKYDANSRSRLVDLSQVTEPEIPDINEETEPEVPEPEEPETADTPVIDMEDPVEAESMESFLELPAGVTVTYLNAAVCKSYPEDGGDYFTLEAAAGKNLLVLSFQINNTSETEQMVDLLHRSDVYSITVNETYKRTALTTMLMNDMSTYLGRLEPGASEGLVLLIEIDESQGQNLESVTLNLKNESNIYTLQAL